MDYCVSYDRRSHELLDFLPTDLDPLLKNRIITLWEQPILRQILLELSTEDQLTAIELRKRIGHSPSTLHENIKRLEEAGVIESSISYKGNKQRILKPKILFVTENPKYKRRFQEFFQGLWIDSKKTGRVLDFLKKHPTKYFTIEQISSRTKIPASEVRLTLNNLESPITRTFADFRKRTPFEKKTLYRIRR